MSDARRGGDPLVRTYVVTGGRSRASRNTFDHITLVVLSESAKHLSRNQLNPEQHVILQTLAHSAQSVAELSALVGQPVSVLRILLADLLESGFISTRQRILDAAAPDRELLEAVLAGLQRL
ncbi:DUF742 domain-containing protein [Streptomyces sp. NPDC046977]|uniref:DUF742 domain-containing protein n=1 Tax=Streptomyces sp. NPDC046977 TaxID=3154703 RepID=UPI0033E14CF5